MSDNNSETAFLVLEVDWIHRRYLGLSEMCSTNFLQTLKELSSILEYSEEWPLDYTDMLSATGGTYLLVLRDLSGSNQYPRQFSG